MIIFSVVYQVPVELRPYQTECLARLLARYRAGKRRVLVSLPTGTGKTVVFAQFPRHFQMKKRLLVLAHRQELLDQAAAKFAVVDPSLSVGVEQASRRAGAAKVVVASVPTLQGARLQELPPDDFNLIVVDEAHHAVAKSYRTIFEHFGLFDPATPKMLVGFTATPRRGDRQSLGDVFEEVAYTRGLEEMILAGFLARVSGWRITTNVSLDGIKVRAGDFMESELAERVNVVDRNEVLLGAYLRFAPGRRTVVFCVDVEHAKNVAQVFVDGGIRAQAVWGAMPRADREAALAAFHDGRLDVLTNCNLLTEGFDEPRVDCVMMARPTKSMLLYAQMAGRGTRLHPDKQNLLVIDIVDSYGGENLASLNRLFELPTTINLSGEDALATATRLRDLGRRMPWVDLDAITEPDQIEVHAERIDLFRFDPPAEIADQTDLTWLSNPGGGYRLNLPDGEQIIVDSTLLGDWDVRLTTRGNVVTQLGRGKNIDRAITVADRYVETQRTDALKLLERDARWRDLQPTDKQLTLLRNLGLPSSKELTRGQATWMISYSIGNKT